MSSNITCKGSDETTRESFVCDIAPRGKDKGRLKSRFIFIQHRVLSHHMVSSTSSHTDRDRNSMKHYDEPSSSLLRTPPPISTYPNLQGILTVQSTTGIKTRRQSSESDSQECLRCVSAMLCISLRIQRMRAEF